MNGMLNMQKNILPKKIKVYNLTVENNNEYFANDILVHNCDAASMLPEMLQFAPNKQKENNKEDIFKFLQKQTNGWRAREQRTSRYIFGQKSKQSQVDAKVGLVNNGEGLCF